MTELPNESNVRLLSFKTVPPFFEVVGNPEREDVQTLCRNLINYGANPMLWGDRDPPAYFKNVGKGFALVRAEGTIKLIFIHDLKPGQQIMCFQTYRQDLNQEQLDILRRCSLFLYGLDDELAEYTEEQKESMKRRMLSSFKRQVATTGLESRPPFATEDDEPIKKFKKECEEAFFKNVSTET